MDKLAEPFLPVSDYLLQAKLHVLFLLGKRFLEKIK